MPLQNRVDPFGHIHANPARGLFMGNRGGCMHDNEQNLKPKLWVSDRWITCLLSFKGRKRQLMTPGHYTEVFFLDEATAFAAGHRPCFECQRQRATEFGDILEGRGLIGIGPKAPQLDALIARQVQARLKAKKEFQSCPVDELPNGAMFDSAGQAFLKWRGEFWLWSFDGYKRRSPETLTVVPLTPPAVIEAFRAGFVPVIHESAA